MQKFPLYLFPPGFELIMRKIMLPNRINPNERLVPDIMSSILIFFSMNLVYFDRIVALRKSMQHFSAAKGWSPAKIQLQP